MKDCNPRSSLPRLTVHVRRELGLSSADFKLFGHILQAGEASRRMCTCGMPSSRYVSP